MGYAYLKIDHETYVNAFSRVSYAHSSGNLLPYQHSNREGVDVARFDQYSLILYKYRLLLFAFASDVP